MSDRAGMDQYQENIGRIQVKNQTYVKGLYASVTIPWMRAYETMGACWRRTYGWKRICEKADESVMFAGDSSER